MSKKKRYNPYTYKTALKLSLLISILLVFIMLLGVIYAQSRDFSNRISVLDVIRITTFAHFLTNTAMLFVLFSFQFRVIQSQRKKQKKMLLVVLGSFALVLIMSPAFAQLHIFFFEKGTILNNLVFTVSFVKDMILLIIVSLFTTLMYLWEERQKTVLENQKLLTENLQNRYDVLKSQVDPHFLFNSLNTLNGLIGFDDEKAHEYVDRLSSVFRYTMQNKEILPLSDEIDFAMSYLYLIKIRYNGSIQITWAINEKYLGYYILPCGLQLLIENVVKHNVISNKYPLGITIATTTSDSVVVRNKIQLKPEVASGGGVGLANLNERYQLLCHKEITITESGGIFSVEVPLIETKDKKQEISHESSCC